VLHSNAADMPEIIVRHTHRLQPMHTRIHVEAGLNVVAGHPQLLELLSSASHRKRKRLVLLGHPAPLDPSLLLLVARFLLVLAKHRCDWLDGLLQLDLPIVAGGQLSLFELRLSPGPEGAILGGRKLGIVLGDVVSVLLRGRVLGER
jgi:hypothetical protein